MATAQTALSAEEKYETLSHLYLLLWKQLDQLLGDTKWLEVVPSEPDELRQEAGQALDEVHLFLREGELWRVVKADYERTQELVAHSSVNPKPEIESVKNYLRDQGLRYAEEI